MYIYSFIQSLQLGKQPHAFLEISVYSIKQRKEVMYMKLGIVFSSNVEGRGDVLEEE